MLPSDCAPLSSPSSLDCCLDGLEVDGELVRLELSLSRSLLTGLAAGGVTTGGGPSLDFSCSRSPADFVLVLLERLKKFLIVERFCSSASEEEEE